MPNRIPLPAPIQGLSDNRSSGQQEPLTSTLLLNTRSIDPVTGQIRLCQRPGFGSFIDLPLSEGARVEHVARIAYELDRFTYTQLTTTGNERTTPALISEEWSQITPSETEVLDTWVDESGVYALDSDGSIVRTNRAGENVKIISLPIENEASVVRRIVVDPERRIYAASSGGGEGKIWQFRPLDGEEQLYQRKWEIAFEGEVVTFDVGLGLLVVGLDFTEGDTFSAIHTYSDLFLQKPNLLWERGVPNPIRGLAINELRGGIHTSHPSNPERGSTPDNEGYVESDGAGFFTVHDIGKDVADATDTDDSKHRLHSLLLPSRLEGLSDGEEVLLVPDHRYVLTTEEDPGGAIPPGNATDNPAEYEGPTDNTPRTLAKFENAGGRHGPVYRSNGAGPNASLHFNGGRDNGTPFPGDGLRSSANEKNLFKTDEGEGGAAPDHDGTAPFQRAIVPGHTTGHNPSNGWGNGFQLFQVWRLPPKQDIGVILTQNGDPVKYALLANASVTDNGGMAVISPNPGHITFVSNKMRQGDSLPVLDWPDFNAVSGEIDPDGVNDDDVALITIGHSGYDFDSTDASTYENQSFFRINGRPIAKFTMRQIASYGDQAFTVLGNPHWKDEPSPADLFDGSQGFEVGPLFGDLLAHTVLFGATSAPSGNRANDQAPTYPQVTSNGEPPTAGAPSGSIDPTGHPGDVAPPDAYTHSATDCEMVEGGLAHELAIPHLLPNATGNPQEDGLFADHPFGGATSWPIGYGRTGTAGLDDSTLALQSARPIAAKWGPKAGNLRWAFNGSGIGNGVIPDAERGVFLVGEKDPSGPAAESNAVARKVIDLGNAVSISSGDGAWLYESTDAAPQFPYPSLAVDQGNGFYWAQGSNQKILHIDPDGALVWTYLVGSTYKARSISLDPDYPAYPSSSAITGPPFVYVGSTGAIQAGALGAGGGTEVQILEPTLRKLRVVAETQVFPEDVSLRRRRKTAVCNGNLYVFDRGGTASIPTGGQGAFDPRSPYVFSDQLFGKRYYTDGSTIQVFDPVLNTLREFRATDAGTVPERTRLLVGWHGRLVLADEQNWHMSQNGNPKNWDLEPAVLRLTDAVSGPAERGPENPPDLITALIPATSDLLLFGCESSIHRMTGDPLAGGSLDLYSSATGVAFGKAWAKDPNDNVYAFSSVGGLLALPLAGGPVRISIDRIERRLQDVDLSKFRVDLEWSWREEGLWILLVPLNCSQTTGQKWFFWDKRNNAWHENTSDRSVRPTCLGVYDGDDPLDRVLALGCQDGKVRFVDADAQTDDGERIESRALIGPIADGDAAREVRFTRLLVALAESQGGCRGRWYASNHADADISRLTPVSEPFELGPGLNPPRLSRASGKYVWLELFNESLDRWAFESATINAHLGGQVRVR